jgi:hypothetical protein
MKNAMYEEYFKERKTMKMLAMLLILFSLAAGSAFTERADAEDMRKTGDEQVQPSQPAKEKRETGSAETEDAKNTVAAKVNGVVITNDTVTKLMKVLVAKTEDRKETKELREKALDSLIFQELAYQKAKADGLTVEQKTLDDAIDKIKTSYGGENGYRAFLEREKMTEEELRQILERSFILKMITEREVLAKIVVSRTT